MKQIIILQIILLLFLLLFGTTILSGIPFWVKVILFGVCLGIVAIQFLVIFKQNKLMEYMLREQKKKKEERNTQIWSQKDKEQLQLIRKRVEVSVLQSQINPHFLYNTLDSIRSKALLSGQKEIASMTEILSKFFRYCISSNEHLVKIREEIHHIEDYNYIQKYRFEDRYDMVIEVEDEEILEYYIPKMTLQPLVENAMIHGLEKIEGKGLITIKLIHTDKKVVIVITDNGAGMNEEQLSKLNARMNGTFLDVGQRKEGHSGIALTNVNSRIRITFGDEYGIHYQSVEGMGTDAIITVPIVDEFARVKYENILEDSMN